MHLKSTNTGIINTFTIFKYKGGLNMKKTVYLAVLSLVTVFCIIIGSIYHISGWVGFGLGNLFHFISGSEDTGSGTNRNRITYSEDLSPFSQIEIDTDVMNINIEKGDNYHLEYDCTENRQPEIEVTGNKLKLKQPKAKGWLRNHINYKCDMTLTIPEGTVLDNADITTDVGNVYINNTECNDIKLELDVGNLEIKLCTFKDSEIESDVGNIKINQSDIGNSNIETDTGDVNIKECEFKDIEIYNDIGNVDLDSSHIDISNYSVDLSTDLGAIRCNGTKQKKHFYQAAKAASSAYMVTIETDIGSITFN